MTFYESILFSLITGIVSGIISGLYSSFVLYKFAVFLDEKKALINQLAPCNYFTIHNCHIIHIHRDVYTKLINIRDSFDRLGHTKAFTLLSKLLDELLEYEDGLKLEDDLFTQHIDKLHLLTQAFLIEVKPDVLTLVTSKTIANKVRIALNFIKGKLCRIAV